MSDTEPEISVQNHAEIAASLKRLIASAKGRESQGKEVSETLKAKIRDGRDLLCTLFYADFDDEIDEDIYVGLNEQATRIIEPRKEKEVTRKGFGGTGKIKPGETRSGAMTYIPGKR